MFQADMIERTSEEIEIKDVASAEHFADFLAALSPAEPRHPNRLHFFKILLLQPTTISSSDEGIIYSVHIIPGWVENLSLINDCKLLNRPIRWAPKIEKLSELGYSEGVDEWMSGFAFGFAFLIGFSFVRKQLIGKNCFRLRVPRFSSRK